MSQEQENNEMVEIIDFDENLIDSYVDSDTEAQLTTFYEAKDSFFDALNETEETEYTCPMCKEILIGKKEAKAHVARYFKYVCDVCDKRYFRAKYLQAHLKSAHLKSKELKCPICEGEGVEKVFKAVNNLKQHLLLHSEERQYVCDYEGCNKSFKQKPGLHQHIRFKHKNSDVFCTICRKRVDNLKEHNKEAHSTAKRKNYFKKQKKGAKKPRKDLELEEPEFYDSENETDSDEMSATWKYSSDEEYADDSEYAEIFKEII